MKKVLCILAAVAMIAAVSTSCKKNCTCDMYENGKVVSTTTYEAKNGACANMSTVMTTPDGKVGMECK